MIGAFLVCATCQLTVNTMGKMKYHWMFFHPFAFGLILLLDEQKLLSSEWLGYAYAGFMAAVLVKYLGLLGSVVV